MQKGAGARGNGQGYDPPGEGGWGEIEDELRSEIPESSFVPAGVSLTRFLFCVTQLRRMQEMIAKMQAQMQRQGDGEGEVPHMWKKGRSRRSRRCSSVRLRCHNSCKSSLQVSVTVDGRDDHLVTFYCLPLFCCYLTENLEPPPLFFNTFIVYSNTVIFAQCYFLIFLLNFCQLLIWSCASKPLYEDVAVIVFYQDFVTF